MTKPASIDLRFRVVMAMIVDGNCRAVANRFGVAPSSVVKWTKRFRETGVANAAGTKNVFSSRIACSF